VSRYATALAADPYQTYRQIDLAGKTATTEPHKLVGLLYDELIRALRTAAIATEQGNHALKSERVTKATAILFALESGLDFVAGGDVAVTLATLYRGVRSRVVDAAIGSDPAPFRESADMLAEIAEAWASVGLA
jgi:flagellar secretion chaperone FliS